MKSDLRLNWLIAIALAGWLMYLLTPILTPFVASAGNTLPTAKQLAQAEPSATPEDPVWLAFSAARAMSLVSRYSELSSLSVATEHGISGQGERYRPPSPMAARRPSERPIPRSRSSSPR